MALLLSLLDSGVEINAVLAPPAVSPTLVRHRARHHLRPTEMS